MYVRLEFQGRNLQHRSHLDSELLAVNNYSPPSCILKHALASPEILPCNRIFGSFMSIQALFRHVSVIVNLSCKSELTTGIVPSWIETHAPWLSLYSIETVPFSSSRCSTCILPQSWRAGFSSKSVVHVPPSESRPHGAVETELVYLRLCRGLLLASC